MTGARGRGMAQGACGWVAGLGRPVRSSGALVV